MVTTSLKIPNDLKLAAIRAREAIVATDGCNQVISPPPRSPDQYRRIGMLHGKAEVNFGNAFTMTDEGLLDA